MGSLLSQHNARISRMAAQIEALLRENQALKRDWIELLRAKLARRGDKCPRIDFKGGACVRAEEPPRKAVAGKQGAFLWAPERREHAD